jgi:hypothetical protein
MRDVSTTVKLTPLTPPDDEARAFEVRSAADAREPVRLLRALGAHGGAVVVISPAPAETPGLDRLIEAMMPRGEVPSPIDTLRARRNAEARWRLLSEFGALTAADVSAAAGSRSKNTSALAGRWLRDGDVIAVTHDGTRYFPAFQFGEDGRPLPVMKAILPHLSDLGDWQRAIWFVTGSRLLGDRRPVDLLTERPDEVVAAARMGATPLD